MKKLLALLFLVACACNTNTEYKPTFPLGQHHMSDFRCQNVKANVVCINSNPTICRVTADDGRNYRVLDLVTVGDRFCCYLEYWSNYPEDAAVKCVIEAESAQGEE
ncbi:MAG: hypothetical protein WC523_03970 [Patescibacteria group bacterium]